MTVFTALACCGRHRVIITSLLLAALLGPVAGAADLADEASESPVLQEIAAEYYSRKYKVHLTEAYRRLAIQDRAAGLEDDLERVLGAQYAGIWFDPGDRGRLKIGMTPVALQAQNDVHATLDRLALSSDADLVPVRFTEAELERKVSDLNHSMSTMLAGGRVRIGYSTKANSVILTALGTLPQQENRLVEVAGGTEGVVVRRVNIPSLRGQLRACGVRTCEQPFRGGREIASIIKIFKLPPGAKLCTAAFIARHRVSGDWMAMTAGHCLRLPQLTLWGSRNQNHNWMELGNTAGWVFPGMDAGVVQISSWYWTTVPPKPWVVVKASDDTTYDPKYPIRKDGKSSLHSIKCVTGRTTGTHCGEVIELGASGNMVDNNGNSHPLQNMGVIDECIAKDGDSGGPVYKNKTAYGILVGVLPTPDLSCNEFYQGIRGAENALNVDVQFAP